MATLDADLTGEKRLLKALDQLGTTGAKKVVRQGLRDLAKSSKKLMVQLLRQRVKKRTGRTLAAFRATKIRAQSKGNKIRIGVKLPERSVLGIPEGDKHYYPAALEYGTPRFAGKRFIRDSIDKNPDRDNVPKIIAAKIEKELQRRLKK